MADSASWRAAVESVENAEFGFALGAGPRPVLLELEAHGPRGEVQQQQLLLLLRRLLLFIIVVMAVKVLGGCIRLADAII